MFEIYEIVVANALLIDLLGRAERGSLEALVSLKVGQSGDQLSTRASSDFTDVAFRHPSEPKDLSLHQVLVGHVVDATRSQNHVRARGDDHLNSLFKNV